MRAPSSPLLVLVVSLLADAPMAYAADGLDDAAAGKAAARCHAAVTKAGRAFATGTLQKLGQCTTSVLKCIRTKPGDGRCRDKAASKCTKTLAKLNDDQRIVRTIDKGCRNLDPPDLLGSTGLGYAALAGECPVLDGSATVADCVRTQHRCAVERLLSVAQPRAYEALGLVDGTNPASTCLAADSSAGAMSPPELAKPLARCDKALTKAAQTFVSQELASRQKCLAGMVACTQRQGGDTTCVAKAAAKCGKLRSRRDTQATKLRATVEKQCGDVPFDALAASTGIDLGRLASTCEAHGLDPTTSLGSYGACLVEHHRCRVEEVLFFEAPRAAELLAEAGEPFGATCGGTFVAFAGGDLDVVLGDTVVLNAEVRGGLGLPAYTWTLLEAPPDATLELADPTAARQIFAPDATGDYHLGLVAEAAGRTSAPATVTVRVTTEPPPPIPVVAVGDVRFTRTRDGVIDPSTAIVLAIDGPVDPASLTPQTIRLETSGGAIPIDVAFDPGTSSATVTPQNPLPLGSMFTLSVHDVTATETPYEFVPFEHPFLTPAEVTARVEGEVLAPDRHPLEFVTLRLAGRETVTDPDGHFHFDGLPEGAYRLEVDPSTVDDPVATYTPLNFLLDVAAGDEPTTVGHPIVLTVVDQSTAIAFPAERVLTSPVLPGLRVDFTGVTARNPGGTIYTGPITVSPVGRDDVPMRFPDAGASFWTIQPGGLELDPPATITVPLPIPMAEGEEIDLWAFDHATNQWVAYGRGIVDMGGATATSLPGEGLPFTGWHSLVTRREVVRDIGATAGPPQPLPRATVPQPVSGTIVDATGSPLHGVLVEGGGDTAYTDYTGSSFNGTVLGKYLLDSVLVGYNVYVNGAFDHFEPRNPEICATATDLLLKSYRGCVTADVTAHPGYDPSEPDGNIIGVIQPAEITLADYRVVDDMGDIHLHRDAHYPALRSHRIRWQLDGTPIGDSQRYRDEVMAVTEKLASLGFREQNDGRPFLTPTATFERDHPPLARARCPMGPHRPGAAHRAVRLFEALWLNRGAGRIITEFEGEVGELVLQGLNDADDVLWAPANAAAVQSLHGFSHQVNPTKFIHPTVTKRLIAIRDTVGTNRLNSLTLPLGGDRDLRCDPKRKLVHDHFHAVGSAVDFGWLQPAGTPGSQNFYRPLFDPQCFQRGFGAPLPFAACMPPITFLKGEVPDPSEEWQPLVDPFASETEAIRAGRTWQTKPSYSRDRTRDYVEAIKAQPNRQIVIFNDPRIVAGRAAAHSNHIHAEFYYERGDFHPAGADGTPPFPHANPRGVGEGLTILRIGPDDGAPIDTLDAAITIEFSAAVDPTTLGPDSLQLFAYRTAEAIPVAIAVGASESGGPGTLVTLVPAGELPENTPIALAVSEQILGTDGAPLVLPDDGPIVAEFATALSSTITAAAFVGDPIALTREDLSATHLDVLGSTDNGASRPIIDSMERFSMTDDTGRRLDDVVGEDARLGRVLQGRSILRGTASNGVEAHALVEADLLAAPTARNPVARVSEPLSVEFDEAVDGGALVVVGAEIIDQRSDRYAASITFGAGGQRVDVTPASAPPRYQDLDLELTVRVTDPGGDTVDVVTTTTFFVVGVQNSDLDTDGDGLPDVVEDALGDCVDSTVADTDGDGITDDLEDCDDDTLSNGLEATLALNPGARDTDGDGIFDPMELTLGCNPRAPETTTVIGRTVDGGAVPVPGVVVRALGRTATSTPAGAFAISGVPACPERTFRVAARLESEPPFEGVSASATSVLGGMTDVGDLTVLAVTDPLYPPAQFAGNGADVVRLVDVDLDGVLDAVTVDGTVLSVLLGRGDGTFAPQEFYPAGGGNPRSLDAADVNTDGFVDLVTCVTGGLSVLFGNGDGTFADGQIFAVSGNPRAVAITDMNGDMALDLVAASDGIGVVVRLGNGDGTFDPELTFGNDRDQTDIAVGLFDDDAIPDVATSGRAFISSAIGELVVLLGNGDGTLQPEQEFRTETPRPHAMLTDDLDGDGELDLLAIAPQPLSDGISFGGSFLRGNGDGTFQPAEIFVTGTDSASAGGRMALGHFTPDANLDLVTANDFLDLSLLPGNGDGTFQAPISIPRGLVPVGVAVGDLNADGLTDIVSSDTFDRQLWALLGHGDGTFEVAGQTRLEILFESGSGTARRYATADFDGDGHLDLAAAGHRRRLSLALGKGDFFFQPHVGLEALPMERFDRTADVVAGRFDAGDTVDLIALAGQEVVAFLGNGDGTFAPALPTSLGVADPGVDAEELEAADLNGDGVPDLVATLGFDDQVATLLGNGDGTFQPPTFLTGVDRPMGLAVADLDRDGAIDVIVAPFQDTGLGIYRGNGDGTFAAVRFVGQHQCIQVAAVDVNGDTITDLVASGYPFDGSLDYAAFLFLGNGDGTFQREQLYEADECPEGLAAADLTGDDLPDAVVANCGADNLSLFVANGDGTFQPQVKIPVGQPDQLTTGDLNGDGAPDLIVGTEFVDVGILPHR